VARYRPFLGAAGQLAIGECVELRWTVGGEISNIRIERAGVVVVEGAPTQRQRRRLSQRARTFALQHHGGRQTGASRQRRSRGEGRSAGSNRAAVTRAAVTRAAVTRGSRTCPNFQCSDCRHPGRGSSG